jgi:hypothetical protein
VAYGVTLTVAVLSGVWFRPPLFRRVA